MSYWPINYWVKVAAPLWYTAPDNAGIASTLAESQSHPTLLEIEASTILAKEATVNSVITIVALLKKYVRNFKEIIKIGGVNYLVIYDDGEISGGVEIIRKVLKDPSGLDITDIAVGALAMEEASSV